MKALRRIFFVLLAISLVLTLASCKRDNGDDTPANDCSAGHTYDNDCDWTCNLCGERRRIEHVFDSSCDTECNICQMTQTPHHEFDNNCDTECNNCDFERTVMHNYDHGCDVTCNDCSFVREQNEHVYTDECDVDCNECRRPRVEVPHLDGDNNGICDLCDELLFIVTPADKFDLPEIPIYDGTNFQVNLNGGKPFFLKSQITSDSYEYYSPLDELGRCGVAVGCLGPETLPTDGRDSISSVSPSGWQSNPPIYERSHLIAHSLSGENANRQNLITGTYVLNGVMQTFEDRVCDYIKATGNHVMYRSTPVFEGNNLLATGLILEAYSVEDEGAGVEFCIYIHNVQTDYIIDYATGNAEVSPEALIKLYKFVVNMNSKGGPKIHLSTCRSVSDIKESNKAYHNGTAQEIFDYYTAQGKTPSYCGSCKPQNAARQVLFTIPTKQLCPIVTPKRKAA